MTTATKKTATKKTATKKTDTPKVKALSEKAHEQFIALRTNALATLRSVGDKENKLTEEQKKLATRADKVDNEKGQSASDLCKGLDSIAPNWPQINLGFGKQGATGELIRARAQKFDVTEEVLLLIMETIELVGEYFTEANGGDEEKGDTAKRSYLQRTRSYSVGYIPKNADIKETDRVRYPKHPTAKKKYEARRSEIESANKKAKAQEKREASPAMLAKKLSNILETSALEFAKENITKAKKYSALNGIINKQFREVLDMLNSLGEK